VSTPQNVQRLDEILNQRRIELGKSWADVVRDAGITTTSLADLRKGRTNPSPKTLRGMDRAMEWQWNPSSTLAILNGGDPMPLQTGPSDEVGAVIAEIEADENLSREQKDLLVGPLRATARAIREQARLLSQQGADRNAS
jgi:transcriptional regulator with XRE-family HTH domain